MAGEAPILLVDNDTCFVADLGDIGAGPDIQVMAGVAGDARVSPAQWEHIERHLRIKPLDFEWCPLKEQMAAFRDGAPPRSRRDLYVNSGVVRLANPREFGLCGRSTSGKLPRRSTGIR